MGKDSLLKSTVTAKTKKGTTTSKKTTKSKSA